MFRSARRAMARAMCRRLLASALAGKDEVPERRQTIRHAIDDHFQLFGLRDIEDQSRSLVLGTDDGADGIERLLDCTQLFVHVRIGQPRETEACRQFVEVADRGDAGIGFRGAAAGEQ